MRGKARPHSGVEGLIWRTRRGEQGRWAKGLSEGDRRVQGLAVSPSPSKFNAHLFHDVGSDAMIRCRLLLGRKPHCTHKASPLHLPPQCPAPAWSIPARAGRHKLPPPSCHSPTPARHPRPPPVPFCFPATITLEQSTQATGHPKAPAIAKHGTYKYKRKRYHDYDHKHKHKENHEHAH